MQVNAFYSKLSIVVPLGLMTICEAIVNSTLLDSLVKNTKFQKYIFTKFKTTHSIEFHLYELILMHMLKKFPNILKKQLNFNNKTKTLYITIDDVNFYFDNKLKYVNN